MSCACPSPEPKVASSDILVQSVVLDGVAGSPELSTKALPPLEQGTFPHGLRMSFPGAFCIFHQHLVQMFNMVFKCLGDDNVI